MGTKSSATISRKDYLTVKEAMGNCQARRIPDINFIRYPLEEFVCI